MILKKILVFIFLFNLLFNQVAFACIGFPSIEFKSEACSISFYEKYKNETAVLELLNEKKISCNLDNTDITILKDYVTNGYSVKEQTKEEYDQFLGNANKENFGRPNDCLAYEAVSHKGRWTGYINSGKIYENDACAAPGCGGASANIKWNELTQFQFPYFFIIFLLASISIIIIVFVYKMKK